jgi:hypothetical protein
VIIGLGANNNIVAFNSATPGTILGSAPVTGLGAGENLVGIDFRPAGGTLFGLSSGNRLYTINTGTGAATALGSAGAFTLSGANFGFDFNPVVDRIRVTSNLDQNLRLNPNDATLSATDTNLAYAAGDPNAAANPNLVGSAYINSVAGAATTTLFGIDSNLDVLVTQNPPNSGTLNTVGALGFNTNDQVGFDIVTTGGVGGANTAYASLTGAGSGFSQLFTINLTTGSATLIGSVTGLPLDDIAIAPDGIAIPGGGAVVPLPPAVLAAVPGVVMMGSRWRRRFGRG